jgi:hypothetical protein
MYCANKRSIQVKMLKNNSYNIDIQFDYSRIKDIVLKSLEKNSKRRSIKEYPQ